MQRRVRNTLDRPRLTLAAHCPQACLMEKTKKKKTGAANNKNTNWTTMPSPRQTSTKRPHCCCCCCYVAGINSATRHSRFAEEEEEEAAAMNDILAQAVRIGLVIYQDVRAIAIARRRGSRSHTHTRPPHLLHVRVPWYSSTRVRTRVLQKYCIPATTSAPASMTQQHRKKRDVRVQVPGVFTKYRFSNKTTMALIHVLLQLVSNHLYD